MERLGEVLLSIGALGAGTLNRALALQRSTGGRLGTILLEQGLVTEETLARALTKVTGRPYAHWDRLRGAARETIALLPLKVAIRVLAVPFERDGRVVRVAMRDPNDLAAEDEIALVTGKKIEPWCTAEFRLAEALERFYGERRSARFRVLSERLERGIRAPTPPPTPPPPPDLRGDPNRREPETDSIPAPGRSTDVWQVEAWPGTDEIEIATWRPSPLARSVPRPTATEIEFLPDEESSTEAVSGTAASAAATPAAAPSPPTAPLAAPVASREFPAPSSEAPSAVPVEAPHAAAPSEAPPAPPESPPPAPVPAPRPADLEQARERIRAAEARDDIADAALDYIEPDFPLTALMIARKDDVIGWQVRSDGASRSAFKAVRIPFKEPSIFLNVKLSGTAYQGFLPDLPSHAALLASFGHVPGRCAVLPVQLKKRVVAFLFLELRDKALPPDRLDEMKALARAIADGLAALILHQRSRSHTA